MPPPRNIIITPLNPRLIADGSQTMLSADVVVQWASPGLEDLAKYEIKVTTDPNGLEEFGEFSKSHDSVAPGSTQLIKNFTEVEDDPQNPRIVVQVRTHAAQAGGFAKTNRVAFLLSRVVVYKTTSLQRARVHKNSPAMLVFLFLSYR